MILHAATPSLVVTVGRLKLNVTGPTSNYYSLNVFDGESDILIYGILGHPTTNVNEVVNRY